ncbi:MAG TPA: prolyl oligopeptidase family serine peptidase, partial [Gemmatales bacterium]|nr:prolyl oligopeptidase family serine peptidase [Gemmatales bacterium]
MLALPRVLALSIFVLGSALALAGDIKKGDYPPTRRLDQMDEHHGTKVADPYRWLENDVRGDKEVADWVAAQNKVAEAFLREIPERESIKKRLTEIWNYERYSAPFKQGSRYFFSKNDGLQNQSVLYVLEALEGEPRVLIDPNAWTKDGTQALSGLSVSDDGKYLAYSVADAGSDWQIWRVIDVDTGKLLPDEIRWVKFSGAAWTRDNRGFFYCRYPETKPGEQFQSLNLNMQMYYHRIGTPQSEDVLVHHRPDQPKWTFQGGVTEDGRYFVLYTNAGGTSARFRGAYRDPAEPLGTFIELVDNFENEYRMIGNDGPVFYFKTDLNAPRGRVIAVDIRKPARDNWQEVIAEAKDNLRSVQYVGGLFVCSYLRDASSHIKVYRPNGKFVRDVTLPGIGSAGGFSGKSTDLETFYTFSSFATPPTIYRYDMLTGESTLFRQAQVKFDPAAYETKQVFYASKDGTRVPMFVTAKKGIALDGSHPTLLYGYGGVNVSLTPGFSPARVAWLEMGGVYAVACLRGGGEYGKEWHLAGTKLKKQNVFDDFIAAAEHLIKEGYTKAERLAIQGGSNGGLLGGAVMCQRPELFGAWLRAV